MANVKMTTTRDGRPQSGSAAESGEASQTDPPVERSRTGGRSSTREKADSTGRQGMRRTAGKRTGELSLDPSLAGGLARIIRPTVEDFPATLIRAVDPVLQEYQREMTRAMTQQVEQLLPAVRETLRQEREQDVNRAPSATERRQPPAPPGDGSEAAERGDASDAPRPVSTAAVAKRKDGSPSGISASTPNELPGGTEMTTEATQSEQTNNEQTSETGQPGSTSERSDSSEVRQSKGNGGPRGDAARGRGAQTPTYYYDPQAAARTGLLNLATAWKNAGSTYQALHAYTEILTRYPQTGAAVAATEGLVDLANTLEKQGRFYAALDIYHKLEALL